jgi:hypothetical protein
LLLNLTNGFLGCLSNVLFHLRDQNIVGAFGKNIIEASRILQHPSGSFQLLKVGIYLLEQLTRSISVAVQTFTEALLRMIAELLQLRPHRCTHPF